MTPCHLVEIETPKKYLLNGLWFGPRKAKRAVVFVHGLSGSVFSMQYVVQALARGDTAVLAFNNRGFGVINRVKRRRGKKTVSETIGAAHERFADCADDVQGAVDFARSAGAREIFVAGHSTGCQKAVYWASRAKRPRNVRGIVLLAPVSDYAAALKTDRGGRLRRATHHALRLIRAGKSNELMPAQFLTTWSYDDAQRFLSLYTPDSKETIFCYEQPGKAARTLRAVRLPILVLWAEKDEYADRSPREIAEWFGREIRSKNRIAIIPGAGHPFRGAEKRVAHEIGDFMKSS